MAAVAEVVIGPVQVRGNHTSEIAAILLAVCAAGDIQHALRMGIAIVGWMGRAIVEHVFVDGIGGSVWKDAGGKAGDYFFDLQCTALILGRKGKARKARTYTQLMTNTQHILVDVQVVAHKVGHPQRILKHTTHAGGKMDDLVWPVFVEN